MGPAHQGGAVLALPAADGRAPYQARAAHALLVAALVFNAALCFLNTAGFPVSGGTVIGAEVAIIALTLGFALDERAGPWLILAGLVTYGLLLLALRGSTDVKGVRDFLIPVVFYNLGMRNPDLRDADRAVLTCGVIVVAMGLFEYGLFDVYQKYFNIVRYYVARGSMSASEINELTGSLFTSGIRPDSRTILPFLGPHRVSSVFLEPVSTAAPCGGGPGCSSAPPSPSSWPMPASAPMSASPSRERCGWAGACRACSGSPCPSPSCSRSPSTASRACR
jgi:putative polymerase